MLVTDHAILRAALMTSLFSLISERTLVMSQRASDRLIHRSGLRALLREHRQNPPVEPSRQMAA